MASKQIGSADHKARGSPDRTVAEANQTPGPETGPRSVDSECDSSSSDSTSALLPLQAQIERVEIDGAC